MKTSNEITTNLSSIHIIIENWYFNNVTYGELRMSPRALLKSNYNLIESSERSSREVIDFQ